VIGEIHPVLADLEPGIGELELLQVDVIDGVARDLVPGRRQRRELRPGQFPRRRDVAAVDVERRGEAMVVQRADPLVDIGVAVIELDRNDGQRRRVGGARTANRLPTARTTTATTRDRLP